MLKKSVSTFTYYEFQGKSDTLRQVLEEEFNIHELEVEDVFSTTQLSKVEERPQYVYFALQFPEYLRGNTYVEVKQIHCFVSPKFLILIDEKNLSSVNAFRDIRDEFMKEEGITPFDVFYEIFDVCATEMFKILRAFQQKIKDVEIDLFEDETEEDLIRDIQVIKKNILNSRSLLEPLSELLEGLIDDHGKYITKTGERILDDTYDKIKKLENNLGNFKGTMQLLTETNELLIARSTNQTIKILTTVNVLLLIPTLLAGFFGMNVYFGWFPEDKNYLPLIGIVSIAILLTSVIFFFFKKKRWI